MALAMATRRRPARLGCLPLLQKATLLLGFIALSAVAAASAGAISGTPCPNVFFSLPLLGCACAARLLMALQPWCSAVADLQAALLPPCSESEFLGDVLSPEGAVAFCS